MAPPCVNGMREYPDRFELCAADTDKPEVKLQEDLVRFHNVYGTFFTGLAPQVRQQGAIFQPTTGVGGGATLKLFGNAMVMADFVYDKTPFNNLYPVDEAERFRFRLGTGGHDRVFGLGSADQFRLLVSQNTYLDYTAYQHREAPDSSALALVDQYGATLDFGFGKRGAGFGLMPYAQQRTEILGSGSDLPPDRIPYNWTIGANLMINFDRTPVDAAPGVEQGMRLTRSATAVFHALEAADLQSNVTSVDAQRDQSKDLLLAFLNTPNYAVIAGNGAEFWANQKDEGGALVGSIVTGLGGLSLQGVGLVSPQSQMGGLGAAFTCAGAGGLPRGVGAENKWAYRGALLACGAVQAGLGALVFMSAPDASSGKDDPIQEVQPGQKNPHLDTSQEGTRSFGLQTLAAGIGSMAYGPFMTVTPYLQTEGNQVSGGGLNVGGVF